MFNKKNKYHPPSACIKSNEILEDMQTFKRNNPVHIDDFKDIEGYSTISNDKWWSLFGVFNSEIEILKDLTLTLAQNKIKLSESKMELKETSSRVIEELETCLSKVNNSKNVDSKLK